MERRNGGDPLAPPRPPKLLPNIHRPRASEPPMMNANLQYQQQQQYNNNSINSTVTTAQTQLLRQQQQHLLLISPSAGSSSSSNNTSGSSSPSPSTAITTAPLAPLQQSISFSRRRPPIAVVNFQPTSTIHQIPSLSSNIQSIESPVSPVTLAAPRPDNERLTNEYVDTPFKSTTSQLQQHSPATVRTNESLHPNHHNYHQSTSFLQSSGGTVVGNGEGTIVSSKSGTPFVQHHQNHHSSSSTSSSTINRPAIRPTVLPVTKQPLSQFSKELQQHHHQTINHHDDVDSNHHQQTTNGDAINSITCPECQKCRCESCQRPRQLPSHWLCDDTCLCSAETVIDYISCLCCVKALYYHCSKDVEMDHDDDSDTISCADDPCSCVPYNRTSRWGCLGALSILLPCLWCYWPMRGCSAICAQCYAKHSRHGCRCTNSKLQQHQQTTNHQSSHNHHLHHQNISNSSTIQTANITGRSILRGVSVGMVGVHGGGGGGNGRNNELTPEKRLLDSSPEF